MTFAPNIFTADAAICLLIISVATASFPTPTFTLSLNSLIPFPILSIAPPILVAAFPLPPTAVVTALTPAAARPFKLEVSYLTLFVSCKFAGIGNNIVPAFINGLFDNLLDDLLPARFV